MIVLSQADLQIVFSNYYGSLEVCFIYYYCFVFKYN